MSEYLPMINNVLFAVTKTSKGKFVDTGFAEVFDIASMWMRVANDNTADMVDYDKATAKAVCTLGEMPEFYIKGYLAKKTGVLRKHVYSARSSFTSRSVIVSKPGKHKYNEIEVPWNVLISVYRPHVLNKLMQTGKYSYKEASNKIFKASKKFDQEIADIGEELLREAKNGEMKAIIHRNPSLLQASALWVTISKFKHDIKDQCTGFSQQICKGPNADYDGEF